MIDDNMLQAHGLSQHLGYDVRFWEQPPGSWNFDIHAAKYLVDDSDGEPAGPKQIYTADIEVTFENLEHVSFPDVPTARAMIEKVVNANNYHASSITEIPTET